MKVLKSFVFEKALIISFFAILTSLILNVLGDDVYSLSTNIIVRQELTKSFREALHTPKFKIEINSMSLPEGYCVDKNGKIYFLDTWVGIIKCFDNNGEYIKNIGVTREFPGANTITVDSNNNFFILVESKGKCLIKKYGKNFKFKKNILFKIRNKSCFKIIADNKSKLFVCDYYKGKVSIINLNNDSIISQIFFIDRNKFFVNNSGFVTIPYSSDIINTKNIASFCKEDTIIKIENKYIHSSICNEDVFYLKNRKNEKVIVGPKVINNKMILQINTDTTLQLKSFNGELLCKKKLSLHLLSGESFVDGMDGNIYLLCMKKDKNKKKYFRTLLKITIFKENKNK